MVYKLLGYAVWKGAKWFVRRKYGSKPRDIFAGTVAGATPAGALLALRGSRSG
jgi:hypothetical protein